MGEDGGMTVAARHAGAGLCLAAVCAAADILLGGMTVAAGPTLSVVHLLLAIAAIAYLTVGDRSLGAIAAQVGRFVAALVERFEQPTTVPSRRSVRPVRRVIRLRHERRGVLPIRRGPPAARFVF